MVPAWKAGRGKTLAGSNPVPSSIYASMVFNGSIVAFQAIGVGSSPTTRSIIYGGFV